MLRKALGWLKWQTLIIDKFYRKCSTVELLEGVLRSLAPMYSIGLIYGRFAPVKVTTFFYN